MMTSIGSKLLLLLASVSAGEVNVVEHRTFTSVVYTDQTENYLRRGVVGIYHITYQSSVTVALAQYGNHTKRCQYSFSNVLLTRQFSYDLVRQKPRYRASPVRHGSRTWLRDIPALGGNVKGACSDIVASKIAPIAANSNALGPWKDIIVQDYAIVRQQLTAKAVKRN